MAKDVKPMTATEIISKDPFVKKVEKPVEKKVEKKPDVPAEFGIPCGGKADGKDVSDFKSHKHIVFPDGSTITQS